MCSTVSPNVVSAAEADLTAPEVEVLGTYDTGVGTSDSASEGKITARRIETRPALRPGAVLEYIPGMIITQHSGDGKANQYFLRGFNLDHGTDFAIDVAGMPVNMPTHAHGQGYADLNFLIPELISGIDYRKGPYYAEVGDFADAHILLVQGLHRADHARQRLLQQQTRTCEVQPQETRSAERRAVVQTHTCIGEHLDGVVNIERTRVDPR